MNDTLRALLLSKKFIAALTAIVVAVAARKGFNLDTETVGVIISPLLAYIIGQGQADKGKEAAKVEAGVRKEGVQP